MGWSDSPTSIANTGASISLRSNSDKCCATILTLKHVLNENRALDDLLVGGELLVIGSDEENHDF